MEKEQKQILNKEIIKIDLKNYYIENIKGVALIFAMLSHLALHFSAFCANKNMKKSIQIMLPEHNVPRA